MLLKKLSHFSETGKNLFKKLPIPKKKILFLQREPVIKALQQPGLWILICLPGSWIRPLRKTDLDLFFSLGIKVKIIDFFFYINT